MYIAISSGRFPIFIIARAFLPGLSCVTSHPALSDVDRVVDSGWVFSLVTDGEVFSCVTLGGAGSPTRFCGVATANGAACREPSLLSSGRYPKSQEPYMPKLAEN